MPSGEQKKENNPPPLHLNNRTYFAVARARGKMGGMVQDPAGHLRMVARMGLQPSSSRAQAALGRHGTHGALAPTSCPLCLWNLTPISHPWHSMHHFHITSPNLDLLSMPLISAGPASLPSSYLIAAEACSPPLTGAQVAQSIASPLSTTNLGTAAVHRCAVAISTLTSPIHRPQPADFDPLQGLPRCHLPPLHHPTLGSIHHSPTPCLLPQMDRVFECST